MGRALEIQYGTPQHDRLKRAVQERFMLSQRSMVKRHNAWKDADNLYKCFVQDTDQNLQRKRQQREGKQVYTDITIPSSYAILLASHTYWSSVFLGRSPVMQFIGRHGESDIQVQGIEALIDYQLTVGEMLVPLYIWLLDAGRYGFGVIGNYWAEEQIRSTQLIEVDEPKNFMGIPLPGTSTKKTVRKITTIPGYHGNRIFNVRPMDFYPDPRVPLVNFQQGEFCGRYSACGWNQLLKRKYDETTGEGDYFNLDKLDQLIKSSSPSNRVVLNSYDDLPDLSSDLTDNGGAKGRQSVDTIEMVLELIPREWELGPSSYPEKWVITLAQYEVVIGCRPLGAIHDRYPYFLQSYEIEGYNFIPRGMLEVTKPLNDAMSWLLNTHFYNVRKALNDMTVVDPSKVVMKDLTDPNPGKIVRLSPQAYGTDVRLALQQLPVTDVTRAHLADMQMVWELLQRVVGCTDNVMGMVNPGGRKTATEIRTSSTFGVNRMKTFAEFNSALGWAPLAQVLVQNSQQNFDDARVFKIAGELLNGPRFLQVQPEDIAGFYDLVPVDGTMPVDRFAQATLWKEILMGMAKMPQLAMSFDMAGIFTWMAQLAGLKNINQFKVQVRPDQQVMAQAQAGNLVPAQAPGTSPSAGGGANAGQMSGMQSITDQMGSMMQ